MLELLNDMGVCPASFQWYRMATCQPCDDSDGEDKSVGRGTCGRCGSGFADGFRCGGGTHFVCMACVKEGGAC